MLSKLPDAYDVELCAPSSCRNMLQMQTHGTEPDVMCIQELHEAELAFKDVCDQIAKAERFFPVPGASAGNGISAPPRGHSRQLIPKVQPCCHLISGLWHFSPCTSVLLSEGYNICTLAMKTGRKGLSEGITMREFT